MIETRYLVATHPKQYISNPTIDFRIEFNYSLPELIPNMGDWWNKNAGFSGGPPAGAGNSYNKNNPYNVNSQCESLPNSHQYTGNIPLQNYNSTLFYAQQLQPLATQYFQEWKHSINPQTAKEVLNSSIVNNNYRQNDTTPLYSNFNEQICPVSR